MAEVILNIYSYDLIKEEKRELYARYNIKIKEK